MIARTLMPLLAAAAITAAPADARRLDPAKAEDALAIMQKTICSTKEGETVIHWWKGGMFSRVEGEKDRKLFDLQGMNIRQCQNLKDPKRGPGFRAVSREIMLHLDPETGKIMDRWTNPWTGEDLEVIHVANDPVNMRNPMFAYRADGTPMTADLTVMRGRAFRTGNTPLFYENPLGGEFQEWVGGKYHAQEMGADFFYADDLFDSTRSMPEHHSLSWTRLSGWLPWMKMGDRNGVIYTATVGGRTDSLDKLPEPMRTILKERYPQYLAPPPLDDTRPNETSWEVFKKRKGAKGETK
ncbi:hypothetical protein A6F68_02590 [Tsuneonella dongtanensis]|uniref:DUF1838 domain-containing protein n=1 Tax=Tsuneonella dongtanensis TaxID=692370 RepID=A0A1B2AG18_9SPHN|nr:DUF1838 family protein [Tsuneonella dongtanensis]ANY21084.1 hypothetical protein A6F68_02590 [Tsuneonella dongtanensis]